jgi:hypothetical protein
VLRRAIELRARLRRIEILRIANGVARTVKPVQYALDHERPPGKHGRICEQRRNGRTLRARLEEKSGNVGPGCSGVSGSSHGGPGIAAHSERCQKLEKTGMKNAGAH